MTTVQETAKMIRDGKLTFARNHYALSLLHGILQAQHCGYNKITAIEFGVGGGEGFASLIDAASRFRALFNIEIEVIGFDTCTGLPAIKDYRDHPEVWHAGQFVTHNVQNLISQLPSWARLIIGNIADTLPLYMELFKKSNSRLGFVSLDVDLYSSTVPTLEIFKLPANLYVPAVPMYVDDVNWLITFSKFTGEQLAIDEFNQQNTLRKIESKEIFEIENFHVCHIFDHPVRTGVVQPLMPLEIHAKRKGVVHPNGPYMSI